MTNKEKFIDNTPFISFVEVITAVEYQLIKVYGKIVKQDEFNYCSLQQQKNVIYNGC